MNDARDIFCELLVRIVEGGATPEDRETFRGLLREHPELLAVYREQMRMHVLLRCSFDDGADLCDGDAPAVARRPRAGRRWWPLVVKAAAVVLVGAVFWVASSLHPAAPGLRPAAAGREAAAIQLIRFSGAAGLELPAALPGTLRLDAGEAAVRLASGVELALLGPLELEVRDAMQVRLASGRLLAEVPPVASGFTVVTPELEIWDIGTVFGVSVSNGVSDVFVFKGEVQVNEASGEAVDLCAAGEGVRAAPGWRPYKVAADWPEAHRIFAAVRGAAALADPVAAFKAADKIAGMWAEQYLPKEAPPGARTGTYGSEGREWDHGPQAPPGSTFWFRPVEGHVWGNGANWMTGSDSFAGRIPGLNDVVALNSSRISVEGGSALIVPEGTVAGCATLRLNDIPVDSSVHLRVAGGTLACREGVSIGTRGPALMTLTGGTLAAPWLTAGDEAGGLGVISNEHATIRVDRHLVLGWQVGSKGTLVLKEGKTRVGDQLIVGLYGSGILEAESSFTAGRFIVGCMSKGKGTARIGIGATGTVHTVCFIGGRDYSPDDLGMGTLVLRGGTLMFAKGAWENALQIRYRTEGHGELRGWGSVLEPYTGANRIRMVNNGTVVADGEGVDRDLDLHHVVSVTNRIPNGLSGTNGWYAVNRGRVLYPRVWINAPDAIRNVGEWPYQTALGLVNSVRVAFAGATPSTYLRGGLCASDRTDIPVTLPQGRPVGVWCLGLYKNNTTDEPAAFSTAAVTFRYDHTQVKASDVLKLYRHENGGWKIVGRGRPDGTGCLSAAAPFAQGSDEAYNIGWFALVASNQAGIIVTIQ